MDQTSYMIWRHFGNDTHYRDESSAAKSKLHKTWSTEGENTVNLQAILNIKNGLKGVRY